MRSVLRPKNSLFTLRDEYGRGRCVMLASSIITSINGWLTAASSISVF